MSYLSEYPENLAAGQLWSVPDGLVDNAPMLLVAETFAGFPRVYAVAKLSDLADPRLVVVDDTPVGPVVALTTYTADVGPQAFGELVAQIISDDVAYNLRDFTDTEIVAAGLRRPDDAEDLDGVRRLSKGLTDVMRHDPSRQKASLDDLDREASELPRRVKALCCHEGKSCGLTTLYLDAFRDTATGDVRLRYARESNGDDYLIGTAKELREFADTRAVDVT